MAAQIVPLLAGHCTLYELEDNLQALVNSIGLAEELYSRVAILEEIGQALCKTEEKRDPVVAFLRHSELARGAGGAELRREGKCGLVVDTTGGGDAGGGYAAGGETGLRTDARADHGRVGGAPDERGVVRAEGGPAGGVQAALERGEPADSAGCGRRWRWRVGGGGGAR